MNKGKSKQSWGRKVLFYLKTGEQVVIPLRKNAVILLEKYDFELPKQFAEPAIDKLIKQFCKLAGFDNKIQVAKTIGGKVVTESIEKYNLIINHTARRSFATNFYNATKNPYAVMINTGHITEWTFLKYIRNIKEQHAFANKTFH